MGGGQGPTEHGKILRKDENPPTIDQPMAGDNAIAADFLILHPEIGAVMFDKHVPFFKRAWIQQQIQPLPRGQLSLAVLGFNSLGTAALPRVFAHIFKALKNILHGLPPFFEPWRPF